MEPIKLTDLSILAKLSYASSLVKTDLPSESYRQIVEGEHRDDLLTLCLAATLRRLPTEEEEKNKEHMPGVLAAYAKLVTASEIRYENAKLLDMLISTRKNKATAERSHELSTQNSAGTVSELATKFGVSKSEIRRRRAEGTLDSFIASREKA